MPSIPPFRIIAAVTLASGSALAQSFVNLDFSNNVQPTDSIYPNMSTLGPEYYSGLTFDFVNVAFVNGLAVDARVSLVGNTPGYDFVGYLPDYNTAPGGPEGDLGVYYRYNGDLSNPTGGIGYTISFYQGGSNFTTAQTLSNLRFLIYDHDGEPTQSETVRTYLSDGFTGHQVRDGSGIEGFNDGASWRFGSRGLGFDADNADGSFIAYYENTSSVRFDIFSTSLGTPFAYYGVFTAFDGDLSLTNGSTAGFGSFVPVPEPSTSLLTMSTLLLSLIHRRRSR
jgi:hypothetical protein